MTRSNAVLVPLWFTFALVLAQPFHAQEAVKFHARLSRAAIDLAALSSVAGSGKVTAELTGRTLMLAGEFNGLVSPATAAHLDRGVAMGVRGKPIGTLTVTPATEGTVSGSLELTASQVTDLNEGRLYVQIDSEKAPDGNLWGWIIPGAPRK